MAVSEAAVRRLALSLPEVTLGDHGGLTTFKVAGKRFATLGWPNDHSMSLHLTLEVQEMLIGAEPQAFSPVPGAFGARGHTILDFAMADAATVGSGLKAAWQKAAPERLVKTSAAPARRAGQSARRPGRKS